MTTLYVVVVRVDDKYARNYRGPLEELKETLDVKITSALGFRGTIHGSEIVEGTPDAKKRGEQVEVIRAKSRAPLRGTPERP